MFVRLRYLYRAYRYRFKVDPAEIRFVRENLQAAQVAVDIGCHKGAYTYWMRRRVGPIGAVYAFEPQPRQVAYLRETFSAMNYDNVVLVPMAVSDKCGQLPLYLPAGSTHAASLETRRTIDGNSNTTLVEVTTLDDFFASSDHRGPHFLKIDVEGHELSVLQGAQRTLQTHHPTILLECEARHRPDGDVRPVFDFLVSLGYAGSFFCNGSRHPIAAFNPAVHQRYDRDSDHLPSKYVNNFAFVR